MSKFDTEKFENTIIQVIKDNLSAKLIEINSDKNDGIICKDIPKKAYFSTLTDEYCNFNPFIYYQIVEIEPNTEGGNTFRKITMLISVCISDDNNSLALRKKTFRYSRALQEILEKNVKINGYCSNTKFSEIPPINLRLNENSPNYKLGGIILTSKIT